MLKARLTSQAIERLIHEEILHILDECDEGQRDITNEALLHADLGLGSLDLAQLVAVLESKLQADPFEHLVAITEMRTVGDLCRAYQRVLVGETNVSAGPDVLLVSRKRAQARRARRQG
jgi:acyl carrier protein